MFDPRSDYALNKLDPDAIVCKSATGAHIRITRTDFASEDEFLKWKTWSDENYHDGEKADHIYANHTVSEGDAENIASASLSPEIILECMEFKHNSAEAAEKIKKHLTKKQFRRFWQHHVEGLSVETIALREKRDHSSISESISTARKKLLIFFQKNPTNRP